MTNTPVSNLPIVALSDVPDANALSGGLTTALDHIVIPKYATTTARDAANTAPVEGDMCYVTGTGYFNYTGSAWVLNMLNFAPVTYTATWAASGGTAPAIGNGTSNFRYLKLGFIVFIEFNITFGSTTTYGTPSGSNNWSWTLPFTVSAATAQSHAGTVDLADSSVSSAMGRATGMATPASGGTTFGIDIVSGRPDGIGVTNAGIIDGVSPWTWATGDTIQGNFFYHTNV